MDHQPPPFFKRGPAPLAVVVLRHASLADVRRFTLPDALNCCAGRLAVRPPLAAGGACPVALQNAGDYFVSLARYQARTRLRRAQLERRTVLRRQLEAENERDCANCSTSASAEAPGRVAQIVRGA